MSRTYLYGYKNQRLSLLELEGKQQWSRLDPEFRRRLLAMFDAAQDDGKDLGLGGGWRSSETQEQMFLNRYDQAKCPSDVNWDGKCWKKKPGVASAAPPGRSYHEETTQAGHALAADLVGDLGWMNDNCDDFGLLHFAKVNNEPWHVQPVEIPRSRSNYKNQPLKRWDLPGPVLQEDDMAATLWRHPDYLNVFLIGSGPAVNVSPKVYESLVARGVPSITEAHDQLLKTCLNQSGLTMSDLVKVQ